MRYHALNPAWRAQFGGKVWKICLKAPFTCPNWDGTVGRGGCTYCTLTALQPLIYEKHQSIAQQVDEGIAYLRERHGAERFISYFQNYSATYGPPEKLERLYGESLCDARVVGLSIATRADCLPDEVLDVLELFHRRTYLTLEIGLQTANDNLLASINRCETVAGFVTHTRRAKARGLRICVHVIFGLPGETDADVLATARVVREVGADGVKIHNLHLIQNTRMAEAWQQSPWPLLTCEAYARRVAIFLENIPSECVVHRLTGEAPEDQTVAPDWSINKMAVMNACHRELSMSNTWQGKALGEVVWSPSSTTGSVAP